MPVGDVEKSENATIARRGNRAELSSRRSTCTAGSELAKAYGSALKSKEKEDSEACSSCWRATPRATR